LVFSDGLRFSLSKRSLAKRNHSLPIDSKSLSVILLVVSTPGEKHNIK